MSYNWVKETQLGCIFMKKLILVFLCLGLCSTGIGAEKKCAYKEPTLSSSSSTAMSAMAWGLGLVIAIAITCAVVKNSRAN